MWYTRDLVTFPFRLFLISLPSLLILLFCNKSPPVSESTISMDVAMKTITTTVLSAFSGLFDDGDELTMDEVLEREKAQSSDKVRPEHSFFETRTNPEV